MLPGINLLKELQKKKSHSGEAFLAEVHQLLHDEKAAETEILDRIKKYPAEKTPFRELEISDPEHVFSLYDIRSVCIKYRLRFLDSQKFTGSIPYAAIARIKSLEKSSGARFKSFKIMAPAAMFKLDDPNKDPMLFADLGNNKFFFIAKWGNDLGFFRKLLALPLRSFTTWITFLVCLSLLVNLCIPSSVVAPMAKYVQAEMATRAFLLIHFFLLLCGMSLFFFVSRGRSLSELEWNNSYGS